jgi:phosphoribosylformylglycinamidine synthase
MKPAKSSVKALVIRSAGTNCDQETVHALNVCGAQSDLVHINQLLTGRVRLHPYHLMVIPGGFSYGDDISAGKVLANQLRFRLKDQLTRFVQMKKPVVGICNGFQVLVKTGLLPAVQEDSLDATLGLNDSGRFQCQWTGLKLEPSAASWLKGMPPRSELPIAHGEGKFIALNPAVLKKLEKSNQIIFRYNPNPNGSDQDIAGVCNKEGNVIGMMPHPERYLYPYQHPNWTAQYKPNGATRTTPFRVTRGSKKPAVTGPAFHSEWGDGYWFWKCVVEHAKKLSV